MPFLQSSGAISIANLNSFFPGSGTAMSNFYRGGSRVPASKTVSTVTREPASGGFFTMSFPAYFWGSGAYSGAAWNNVEVPGAGGGDGTSVTTGGFTYFRGSLRRTDQGIGGDAYNPGSTGYLHDIFRTQTTSSTTSINGGIPSSGAISLNQFYGAETP